MTPLEKLDLCAFAGICIGLMFYGADEAWDYVAWDNIFMHCLGTIMTTALGAACLTAILFGIYHLFRGFWSGWGRLLVLPWLLISKWLYPLFLAKDWPETNPDPQGTAAFFALLTAAPVVLACLGLGSLLWDLRSLPSGAAQEALKCRLWRKSNAQIFSHHVSGRRCTDATDRNE